MRLCPRGGGGAWGTMWALCRGPRAKVRGGNRAPGRGRPARLARLAHLLQRPPVLRPPARRPSDPSCPHPGAPPARLVPQSRGTEVESSRGRMGRHVAPSSGTQPPVLRPPQTPTPGSGEPRALCVGPGRTCLVAPLSEARPPQPDCRTRRVRDAARAGRARSHAQALTQRRLRRRCDGAPERAWGRAPTEAAALEPDSGRAWAEPPPRAHGAGRCVAGGACVTLRRRGARAPAGGPRPAPAPHHAGVPPPPH